MKKMVVSFLFSGVCFGAYAQVEDIRLGEDNINHYFIKDDSFVSQKDKSGMDIVAATLKTIQKKSTNISYSHHVMAVNTCEKGAGKLITIDKDGEVTDVEDIKIDGSKKMDVLATAICMMDSITKRRLQKT